MSTEVETGAGRKVFDLSLGELGPYAIDFTRSGRFCALAGRKGHLAILDWHGLHTICEVQVSRLGSVDESSRRCT